MTNLFDTICCVVKIEPRKPRNEKFFTAGVKFSFVENFILEQNYVLVRTGFLPLFYRNTKFIFYTYVVLLRLVEEVTSKRSFYYFFLLFTKNTTKKLCLFLQQTLITKQPIFNFHTYPLPKTHVLATRAKNCLKYLLTKTS